MSIDRPLVVGDGDALPFADRTFDYVIAMHLLEHATNPVLVASELQCVAAGGFVQVLFREAELTFGWPYHPWLKDRAANGLEFYLRGIAMAAPVEMWFMALFPEGPLSCVVLGTSLVLAPFHGVGAISST
jgi:hypothetical protein